MNELLLYGEIGFEVVAKDFVEELGRIDGDVTLRINSPGGDVYQGVAIMHALQAHPGRVTGVIEGAALSAASFIAVGGCDEVIARPHTEVMIHDAWSPFIAGNADEVRKSADGLDRLSGNLAEIYAAKAGGDPDFWRDVMRAETWYSAEEALAAGLVDRVVAAERPQTVAAVALSPQSSLQFRYSRRAVAPAPKIPVREEGGAVNALKMLASELGVEPEVLRSRLAGVVAAEVSVTATVELAYPESVQVVPTGKVVAELVGEVPPGVEFTAGDTPEGWGVEVDTATGVVTVTAPAGVEPGTEIMIAVQATGDGEPVEIPLLVVVVAAAEEETPVSDPAPAVDPEVVEVPRAFYEELTKAYAVNREKLAALHERELEEEAQKWLAAGKFVASMLPTVVADLKSDAARARRTWGALPDGSIPRGEMGYSKAQAAVEGELPEDPKAKVAALLHKATAKRSERS